MCLSRAQSTGSGLTKNNNITNNSSSNVHNDSSTNDTYNIMINMLVMIMMGVGSQSPEV